MRHALLSALLLASPAVAQPPACTEPVHRAFDFWLGDWEVVGADGMVLGHNTVTAFANGCGVLEHWRGARGGEGKSINAYDAALGQWTQRWVAAGGTLWLVGGPAAGGMVLTDGKNRITWTPLEDGGVRQVWDVTADGGASWQRIFDGRYTKKNEGDAR